VTTLTQIEANRRNSLLSTGPRTAPGKARSALNATRHGFTGQLAVAIPRGPFAEDPDQIQEFLAQVVLELSPVGLQERAEATQIAALYVRRHRLLNLEAEALARATRISTAEISADLDDPFAVIADEPGTERSAVRALRSPVFEHLPRYEAHLSRELDRCLARFRQLQSDRLRTIEV